MECKHCKANIKLVASMHYERGFPVGFCYNSREYKVIQETEAALNPKPIKIEPGDKMIEAKFERKGGAVLLTINVAEFKTYLKKLGAPQESNGRFKNIPGESAFINVRNHTLCPHALLNDGKDTVSLNMADFYTKPPTMENMTSIARSIQDCVNQIIDHYRPVEISVKILGKKTEKSTATFGTPKPVGKVDEVPLSKTF